MLPILDELVEDGTFPCVKFLLGNSDRLSLFYSILGVQDSGVVVDLCLVRKLLKDIMQDVVRVVQMAATELTLLLKLNKRCVYCPLLIRDHHLWSIAHSLEKHSKQFDICSPISLSSDGNSERNDSVRCAKTEESSYLECRS